MLQFLKVSLRCMSLPALLSVAIIKPCCIGLILLLLECRSAHTRACSARQVWQWQGGHQVHQSRHPTGWQRLARWLLLDSPMAEVRQLLFRGGRSTFSCPVPCSFLLHLSTQGPCCLFVCSIRAQFNCRARTNIECSSARAHAATCVLPMACDGRTGRHSMGMILSTSS